MVFRWFPILLILFTLWALMPAPSGSAVGQTAAPVTSAPVPAKSPPADADHFTREIAPLLSRHCMECHDSTVKKGKLDLSRKGPALKGGESGVVIVPGDLKKSLLWEQVDTDEMPPGKRAKLSAAEKAAVRKWIEGGAVWVGDAIDPLAHQRDGRRQAGQWLRRLTVAEYIETVRAAVEVDIEPEARRILPADLRADGFSNTAYNLNVDLGHVEAYAKLAEIIVERMDVPAFAARHAKCRKLDDACMRELIASAGLWILRGPVQEHEAASLLRVAKAVADEGGDFNEAVRYVVEVMLQSPRFIYRIEDQRGDGGARPVTGYELAVRMSYTLWGAPPDAELMRAAAAGELADRAKVAAQVQRMLGDPRTIKRSLRFIHEWLNLDRLDNMRPAKERFPDWDPQLAADMRQETLAFFEEVVWGQKRPLNELLNAQVTFLTPRLARHYGLLTTEVSGSATVARELEAPVPAPGAPGVPGAPSGAAPRPIALYRFDTGMGDIVHDVSGHGDPLNLKIENSKSVQWEPGKLTITGPTMIRSAAPPKRLIDAIKKSKAITIEAWVTPASTNQTGPARIVTLSSGSGERNVTIGQDGGKFECRLRTTRSSDNGMPALSSTDRTVQVKPTHVVYTRDAAGKATVYINGLRNAAMDTTGDMNNWNNGYRLMLANESSNDRPWLGTYHRVAIYDRALSPQQVHMLGQSITRHDLTSIPARGGILTQGSTLTVGGDDASMVARGLFVLHDLLHSTVGSAPPGVDTTPVPTKAGQSQRTVAEVRLKDASCAGCHSRFEPLAFALEKFNGIGAHSEVDEHGNKLREDGEILIPGKSNPIAYKTTAQLMDILASSDRVKRNMTRKVTQFAIGRPLVEADEAVLDKIHEASQKGGGTYSSLMTAIVLSDLVQRTPTEPTP